MEKNSASAPAMQFVFYWLVVSIPLAWGVWKTLVKLPALFQ